MPDRRWRFVIAILLTALDLVVFTRYFDSIRLGWSGQPHIEAAFLSLLILWTASVIVLWIHVYYDLRQVLRERILTRSPQEVRPPNLPEGDRDA